MTYSKKNVLKGVFWSAVDKFGIVFVQLFLELLMARLLLPQDYGVLGMSVVFLSIAQVFADGGFSNALIQKQDRSEVDFSTVFYFNLAISILIYFIIFVSSPFIASFYDTPILSQVLRIIGLSIIVNSLILIHRTKLSIAMDFKTQAKYSLLAVLFSGIVGLYLAFNNYGIWALVFQSLTLTVLNALFLIFRLRWKPIFVFSKSSFDILFFFGSKLLVASILQAVYNNLYSIFIGKNFSAKDLGLYAKSNQFTLMPISMVSGTLQRVIFPYLSSFKEDNVKLYSMNEKFAKLVGVSVFPLFLCISALAEPLVKLIFSASWLQIIPIIRLLALAYIFYPLIINNMFLYQVKGKTNLFLKLEICSKALGVIILLLTMKFSLLIMCVGLVVHQVFQMVFTSVCSNKLLGRPALSQIITVLRFLFPSLVIYVFTLGFVSIIESPFFQLFYGLLFFFITHCLMYFVFFKKELTELYFSLK